MADMTFFMDPDCRKSKKQMNDLIKAGNTLDCKDLTFYKWTIKDLLPFVRGRDPLRIMNIDAQAIKKGDVDPLLLTFDEALSLMVASPSLIKGPLVQVDTLYIQGLNDHRINRYVEKQSGSSKTAARGLYKRLSKSRRGSDVRKSQDFHSFVGYSHV